MCQVLHLVGGTFHIEIPTPFKEVADFLGTNCDFRLALGKEEGSVSERAVLVIQTPTYNISGLLKSLTEDGFANQITPYTFI